MKDKDYDFKKEDIVSCKYGIFKILLEYCGEGYNGDYNEKDPNDEKLIRVFIFKQLISNDKKEQWEFIDDSTYCSSIPLNTSNKEIDNFIDLIKKQIIKGNFIGSGMSWITLEMLK